jgi:hypothetical protein
MRWEDERYVRLYTRNTPEWLALSWKARGLFALVLREVDRAGLLPLGKLGLKGVAVAIGAPWTEVEGPLAELLEDGCVRLVAEGQTLWIPNYTPAQEANQTDAARKRKSREMARAAFASETLGSHVSTDAAEKARATLNAANVTKRDGMGSQNVTESHDRSHAVTSGHSVPSLAEPSRTEPNQKDTQIARAGAGELVTAQQVQAIFQAAPFNQPMPEASSCSALARGLTEYARQVGRTDGPELLAAAVTAFLDEVSSWPSSGHALTPQLMLKAWNRDAIQARLSGAVSMSRAPPTRGRQITSVMDDDSREELKKLF